ncbi:MAG TPA: riboflavin synthase [Planctomycetota bacterium]|nr:riboflavin synthase [Planctomycetota bacterium]
MFTGIIEAACPVRAASEQGGARRLVLDLSPLRAWRGPRDPGPGGAPAGAAGSLPLVRLGDSVAVNGCCLTVAALAGDEASFDVIPETLGRTNLGGLAAGGAVNVERSLRYGDPVDGHLVSGHVERLGEILHVAATPAEVRVTVGCGTEFARRTLPKGSVAIDGVSLTVAELHADRLVVALVPHTLERTTLARLRAGDRVNLEPDLLGQWVLRAVELQQR